MRSLSAAFCAVAAVVSARAGCNPQDHARFVAGIAMVRGQVRVDRSRLALLDKDRLDPCLPHPLAEQEIKDRLASDLDKGLAGASVFARYSLNKQESADPKWSTRLDPCLLRDQSWKQFTGCYDRWRAAGPLHPSELRLAFSAFRTDLKNIGALAVPLSPDRHDLADGQLTFEIFAPGGRWATRLPDPLPKHYQLTKDALASYLDRFDDGLWRREYIKDRLEEYFARRGWKPLVIVPYVKDPPSVPIRIEDNLPVTQVTFLPPAGETDRGRILYLFLSTRQLATASQLDVAEHNEAIPYQSLDVSKLEPPVFVNNLAFSTQAASAAALGYSAAPVSFEGKAGLQVEKKSAGEPARKDKKRFLGAGFDYRPGQGVRPLGVLEFNRLLGPGSVSVQGGSGNQYLYGEGALSLDFLGFNARHFRHRLSLELRGGSDIAPNRLFGLAERNERRNGGTAQLQLELLRDPLGHSFRLYTGGGMQTVELVDPKAPAGTPAALTDHLSRIGGGAVYAFSGIAAARPFIVRLEPALRGGHAGSGSFWRTGLTAGYRQETLGATLFEINARFDQASRRTPIYELPSFGGVTVLRGFRADDVLARRLWSLQPEMAFAIPGLPRVSRMVRLATFFDVGGVYQGIAAASGFKGGPGIGLRFSLGSAATVRCDWAYGLGRAAAGPGHGRFYLSASSPLPL